MNKFKYLLSLLSLLLCSSIHLAGINLDLHTIKNDLRKLDHLTIYWSHKQRIFQDRFNYHTYLANLYNKNMLISLHHTSLANKFKSEYYELAGYIKENVELLQKFNYLYSLARQEIITSILSSQTSEATPTPNKSKKRKRSQMTQEPLTNNLISNQNPNNLSRPSTPITSVSNTQPTNSDETAQNQGLVNISRQRKD